MLSIRKSVLLILLVAWASFWMIGLQVVVGVATPLSLAISLGFVAILAIGSAWLLRRC